MSEVGKKIYPETPENKRLSERIFLKNLDDCQNFPKYFEIETVNACNARCSICTINDWHKSGGTFMTDELFEKIAQEMEFYSNWIEAVCLNRDGEPLIDIHLENKIKRLKEIGIKRVYFATNGSLTTTERARNLIESGIDEIMISIDGSTKETFESIRKGLNFENVVENTLNLIKIRNELNSNTIIKIRMVENDLTRAESDDFLKYWLDVVSERDDVYIMQEHSWGNQYKEEPLVKIEQMAKKPCVSPFSTMIIQTDGKIPLCGVDYNARYVLGNCQESSISEIWRGRAYSEFRRAHAFSRRNCFDLCRGCDLWERPVIGRKNKVVTPRSLEKN